MKIPTACTITPTIPNTSASSRPSQPAPVKKIAKNRTSPSENRDVPASSPAPRLPSITSVPSLPGVIASSIRKPATRTAIPTPVYARTCRTDSNIFWTPSVGDDVRHEPRKVVGHEPVGLADPEPGGLHVDGPDAQHGAVAVVVAEVGVLLDDEALVAVALVGAAVGLVTVDDDHAVGALAREQRLLDVAGELVLLVLEERGEQVRMVRVQAPEHREDALVGPQHLPDRLDPERLALLVAHSLQRGVGELLVDQPLPRVELEDAAHRAPLGVDEADLGVQAHLLDRHQLAVQTRLARGLDHVGDGHEVLAGVLRLGVQQVQAVTGQAGQQLLPALHEQFVDHVPLIAAGAVDVLHPVPLDGGLD